MAQNPTAGHGIDDVYRNVIADVIGNLRETFLDENIDIDVLQLLKKEWEDKLNKTGAIKAENATAVPPPAIRSHTAKQPANYNVNQLAVRSHTATIQQPTASYAVRDLPIRPHPIQQQPTTYAVKQLPQLDGGPGMTDSSSESEEEDDEHDSIKRLMGMQDERVEDPNGVDEDPLNSADDQSDEEDLETLFDSDNVVVCQFEKVNRARTKWKFILKDGIMHINGKDYCFQKCTGEAEW